MKKEQWTELKERFSGREDQLKTYVFEMDPDDITEFSQARIKGNMIENIAKYETQFLTGVVQLAPISVIPSVDGKTAKCMDGTTRTKAKQRAKKVDNTQKILVSTYHHVVEGFCGDDWDDFKDQANDHDGAQPATDEDMLASILGRVKSGRLARILKTTLGNNYPDTTTPEGLSAFAKEGAEWAKKTLYKNSSRTSKWFANRIFKHISANSAGPTKMTTRTTEECLDFYSNYGGTKYNNLGTGNVQTVSGDEKVSEVKESHRISVFNAAAMLTFALSNKGGLFTVTLNYTSTELRGLDKDKLDQKRRNDTKSLSDRWKLLKDNTIDLRVVSVPQVANDKQQVQVHYDSRQNGTIKLLGPQGEKKEQMSMAI
tara:strand:+ start:1948 stop:3060 length:1113 start_codon:yes stop_codon:yes gene_type:complete